MGGYTADPNLVCGGTDMNRTDVDKIVQETAPGAVKALFSTPTIYSGPNGQFVYFSEVGGPTVAYSFNGGRLSATQTSQTPKSFGFTGGDAVVSSNGTAPGTGIVWVEGSDSVLRAFDANNLGTELYNSGQNNARDGISGYVKFTSEVVTNGQVFVGLSSSLAIFGLLNTAAPPPLPNGIKISAGGAAPFVADQNFSGGATSGTGSAIDLSGVTNPAPMSVYQHNRFGTFSYGVGGLPTSGSYTVRLHFAESFWTTKGSRIFNVVLNGTTVLPNFDILAQPGAAPNKAIVEQFSVPSNSSGQVNIQFNTVKDNAQVNGIEINPSTSSASPSPSASPSASASSSPPPPPATLQINAGGPAVSPFVADEFFSASATASVTNTIDLSGVTNPAPMSVYQSNRYGNFTYTIPGYTAGSSHTVRLDFAEEYWTIAGSRIFNVLINGNQVLSNFDILAQPGAAEYKAVNEQFTTTANSSGQIVIQFVTVKDNAQVNGIEIS
jgi:Malectin domain